MRLGWPAEQGLISAYPTSWNEQQHIIYIGGPAIDVHELYFDDRWETSDLTKRAVPSVPLQGASSLCGYTFNDSQQIIVNDVGKITGFSYTDHWASRELAAPGLAPGQKINNGNNAVHAHVTDWNNQEHVFFVDTNSHVIELHYGDGFHDWERDDLTARATASNGGVPFSGPGLSTQALTSHATPWNHQQHVIYVDGLGFINELLWNDDKWSHNNLTMLAGAENAKYVSSGLALASYTTEWNKQQHVMYIDVNGHINELVFV